MAIYIVEYCYCLGEIMQKQGWARLGNKLGNFFQPAHFFSLVQQKAFSQICPSNNKQVIPVRSTSPLPRGPIVVKLTAGGCTAAGVGTGLGFSSSPSLSGSSSSGSEAGGGGGARLGQWPISAWSKDTGWEKSDSLKNKWNCVILRSRFD